MLKISLTNGFLKAKSYNFHFHKNDVTWPLSANGLLPKQPFLICLYIKVSPRLKNTFLAVEHNFIAPNCQCTIHNRVLRGSIIKILSICYTAVITIHRACFTSNQHRHSPLKLESPLHSPENFIMHCDIDPHMFFHFHVLAKTRRSHNFKIRPKKTHTN